MSPVETVSTPTDELRVDLQPDCDAPGLPDSAGVRRLLLRAAAAAGRSLPARAEVAVRIVGEAEARRLNREFRGRDRPTNVLAFPAGLAALPGLPVEQSGLLGDLVICAPEVAREAGEQGKLPADHWAHLLVHGFLHLLGYDHRNSDEAGTMETLEARILAAEGVANPYEDRIPS